MGCLFLFDRILIPIQERETFHLSFLILRHAKYLEKRAAHARVADTQAHAVCRQR